MIVVPREVSERPLLTSETNAFSLAKSPTSK